MHRAYNLSSVVSIAAVSVFKIFHWLIATWTMSGSGTGR